MTKNERHIVFDKYGGKCAYCGCELQKGWHVDHIEPAFHNWSDEDVKRHLKQERGLNIIENYNPACPRCNRWKGTWSIEQFRNEISLQLERLERDSAPFRMARDYGLIKTSKIEVKFYYEVCSNHII